MMTQVEAMLVEDASGIAAASCVTDCGSPGWAASQALMRSVNVTCHPPMEAAAWRAHARVSVPRRAGRLPPVDAVGLVRPERKGSEHKD